MVAEGAISAEERAAMVLGANPRLRSELLAPFRTDGEFCGLTMEHCELFGLPDAAWADYEQDGNKEVLANRHVGFFRAIFVPSLATAIVDERKRTAFPDCLEKKLKQRLVDGPAPYHSFVQTLVLAKRNAAPTQAAEK